MKLIGSRNGCPHARDTAVACTPLCSWASVLRPDIRVESTTEEYQSAYASLQTRFKAIHVKLGTDMKKKHLEAIELVLLALHVNPERTWRELFTGSCAVWGVHLPWLEPFSNLVLRVNIEITDLDVAPREAKKQLQLFGMDFMRSVKYRLTRRWIMKQSAPKHLPLKDFHVPVTIVIAQKALQQHHACFAQAIRDISQSLAHSRSSPLRLDGVRLNWQSSLFPSTQLLHDLQAIPTLAVSVKVGYDAHDSTLKVLTSEGIPVDSCSIQREPVESAAFQANAIHHIHFASGYMSHHSLPVDFLVDVLDPHTPPYPKTVAAYDCFIEETLQAVVSDLRARRTSEPGRSQLKSLKLYINLSSDTYIELLQLIGGTLECLNVWSISNVVLGDAQMEAILSACPRLRCLELRNSTMVNIQSIARTYELGLCPSLETLILCSRSPGDDAGILALVRASNDPTSMVHRTLRDLEYKVWITEVSTYTEIIPLLERNHTLRHVRLILNKAALESFHQELKQLRGQRLPLPGAPLSIAKRLALLSAVRGRLDADASRLVMQFSGEAVRRKVLFDSYAV